MASLARLDPILSILPTVERPRGRMPASTRLFWTFVVATVYLIMTITPLYGVPPEVVYGTTSPASALLGIIFGSAQGTLAHLGIGPIVIAGILLEILVFSGVIPMELKEREDRLRFTALLKLVALLVAAVEVGVGISAGQFGLLTPTQAFLVFVQLIFATLIIILMDDLMSKGWGFGSAISLIIFLGVSKSLFIQLFSPYVLPGGDGLPYGFIPALAASMSRGPEGLAMVLYRHGLPDLLGLITTLALIALILYVEMMRVSVPVSVAQYRGIRTVIPLRFVYVSVLPMIFTAYTLTLLSQLLTGLGTWAMQTGNYSPWLRALAGFESVGGRIEPVRPSLLYYILPARTLMGVSLDYVVVHILIYVVLATFFAWVWVSLAGLSPEEQAKRFVEGGLQIPGFRMSERIIAKYLERYIWVLTITSGMLVGLIAALGDILTVYGSGIGLVLLVEIAMQYYTMVMREQVLEMFPGLKRFIGEL